MHCMCWFIIQLSITTTTCLYIQFVQTYRLDVVMFQLCNVVLKSTEVTGLPELGIYTDWYNYMYMLVYNTMHVYMSTIIQDYIIIYTCSYVSTYNMSWMSIKS